MTDQHSSPADPAAPAAVDVIAALQSQIDALRRQIEESDRLAMVGLSAAMFAHEVANLLTPVRTYAQMALDRPGDSRLVEKALRRALGNAERAAAMADALLGCVREPGEAVCDVRTIVGDAVENARSVCEVEVGELRVRMAAEALHQVLVNLLMNASRAVGEEAGADAIRVRARAEGDEVEIEVADRGCGMEAGRGKGGHGLGLMICRRLVESAGGRMTIESGGQGTRVAVRVKAA